MFALYDALTARVGVDAVRMVGDHAWVYSTGEVDGRLPCPGSWVSVLSWQRQLEVARRVDGGDAGGTGEAHCGEHPPGRTG